jgi:creatinine amidohydrolase
MSDIFFKPFISFKEGVMDIHFYIEMSYEELAALNRETTVVFSSISPIETHGPHLPLGTDIFIAESLRDRIIEMFGKKRSDYIVLMLPTIPFGADAIPVAGSMKVRYRAVFDAVHGMGSTLADLGFRYWVLTDNHGGPSHQIAIEVAARKLAKRGFHLIAPFHESFRRMVALDHDLIEKTGLWPGQCGDVTDSHGGTNETSLMLASYPEKIRGYWKGIGAAKKSSMTFLPRLLSGLSKLLKAIGARDTAIDFYFFAHTLAWINDPNMAPYQGDPSRASKNAGEAMFDFRVNLALELLEQAIAGRRRFSKPIGWSIRSVGHFT